MVRKKAKLTKKKNNIEKVKVPKKERVLKNLGKLYYFAVFYVVHGFMLRDWIFSPTIENIYNGFLIKEIVLSVLNLWRLVPLGLGVEHWVQFVLMSLVYVLPVVWSLRRIILYVIVLLNFVRFLKLSMYAQRCHRAITLNHQVTIRNGAPGAGKTRLAVYEAITIASLLWQKLQYKYWQMSSKVNKWKEQNNLEKLEDWDEVRQAYEYYSTPQTIEMNGVKKVIKLIPCLYSNIGISFEGKMSSQLTLKHAMCQDRAPAYTVMFYDEWGTVFDIEYSKNNVVGVDRLSDNGRFTRQFNEQIIMGTEQDANNTYINMRRVVSKNDNMHTCKNLMQPFILGRIYRILCKFFSKIQKGSKVFSRFMELYEDILNSIGFTMFEYRGEGNTEHHQILEGIKYFIIPKQPSLHYDTRAFRRLSFTRNQRIVGAAHTSLAVEPTEENKQAFLRSFFDERPHIEQDVENIDLLDFEHAFIEREKKRKKVQEYFNSNPGAYEEFLKEFQRGS